MATPEYQKKSNKKQDQNQDQNQQNNQNDQASGADQIIQNPDLADSMSNGTPDEQANIARGASNLGGENAVNAVMNNNQGNNQEQNQGQNQGQNQRRNQGRRRGNIHQGGSGNPNLAQGNNQQGENAGSPVQGNANQDNQAQQGNNQAQGQNQGQNQQQNQGGGGGGGGGGGSSSIDDLATMCTVHEDWGQTTIHDRLDLPILAVNPQPNLSQPVIGHSVVTPDSSQQAIQNTTGLLNEDQRRARANQAVRDGALGGLKQAGIGMALEVAGTFAAKYGPVIAARGATMGARIGGAALGSAVPVVGGVLAAIDLVHTIANIQQQPWGTMFSDILSFLDCMATILQILGDVLGIVAAVLAVVGVVTAIFGVGLAVGGAAATIGLIGLAVSALSLVVSGVAAIIRYNRIVSSEGDPQYVEEQSRALEGNVTNAVGNAGNLASSFASERIKSKLDSSKMVGQANDQAPQQAVQQGETATPSGPPQSQTGSSTGHMDPGQIGTGPDVTQPPQTRIQVDTPTTIEGSTPPKGVILDAHGRPMNQPTQTQKPVIYGADNRPANQPPSTETPVIYGPDNRPANTTPLSQGDLNAFQGSQVHQRPASGDEYFGRFFGGKSQAAGREGGNLWLNQEVAGSQSTIRQDLALPADWNSMQAGAIMRPPKGTTLYDGTVAPVGRSAATGQLSTQPQGLAGGTGVVDASGRPGGFSETWSGGGYQANVPGAGGATARSWIVDVMPYSPQGSGFARNNPIGRGLARGFGGAGMWTDNQGLWRPNYAGTIPGLGTTGNIGAGRAPWDYGDSQQSNNQQAGSPQGNQNPASSFPPVQTIAPPDNTPPPQIQQYDTTLQICAMENPPQAEICGLEDLPTPPHDVNQMVGRVPLISALASRGEVLGSTAQLGDMWVSKHEQELGPAGPWAVMDNNACTLDQDFSNQEQTTGAKDSKISDGEQKVQEAEEKQTEGKEKKGEAEGGSSAVDTIVSAAQNPVVRGLVKIGTGIGGAVAGAVNWIGSNIFGADEPVIDTSTIEQIEKLIDNSPKMGQEYSRFKGQAGGVDNMTQGPRNTVDDQRNRIDQVKTQNTEISSSIDEHENKLKEGRTSQEEEKKAKEEETQQIKDDQTKTKGALDNVVDVYEQERQDMCVWAEQYKAVKDRNEAKIQASQNATQNPQLSPQAAGAVSARTGYVQETKAYISSTLASIDAFLAGAKSEGEGFNGVAYPPDYNSAAQNIVVQFKNQINNQYVPILDAMLTDLSVVTPDRVHIVVEAVDRTTSSIKRAVESQYRDIVRKIRNIYIHLPGPQRGEQVYAI
jgi:hypothetical protein